MRRLIILLLSLLALAQPATARERVVIEETVEVTEYVDEGGSERAVGVAPVAIPKGIARFGPFVVLDGTRAAMVDVTDSASPAQFAAMVKAYPGIARIEMIDVPGTEDDRANLKLGRMIRARGMTTYVPAGGSVRSGGVELFLAGERRIAEPGAEFAVHAWVDEDGREATDYSADAPENRAYLDYYREMGLPDPQARAFYAMTNSVPFSDAKWLTAADMRQWVALD
ncbi:MULTISPECIES: alpha/beta hydrolase [unclassified Novosphingobium]|uniref:alpha/beta hydrolase n=1 Tax=unclassified Novosphingobium TaxID=2644732 RepID=UPI000ECFA3F6|nr:MULTISPECIES: alpha/beta hydrolase [unclassified Novosphingobium]HCF24701.1 alpha/beta hydrolase [Novosphingobium sp.]HQV02090.1 alpha/beta hydrolase [Novosphingobium sp.]